jgi:hypothetical protein
MKKLLGLTCAAFMAVACSSNDAADGSGTVAFTTYGEDYIEKEIPAADVEDGWAIAFEKFLVTFHDIAIAEGDAAPVVTMPVSKLFDNHLPGDKKVVDFPSVPAKAFDRVSFRIAPAVAATTLGDGVTEADKQLMVSNGYALYVEATATKAAVSKKLKWGFKLNTLYDRCKGEVAGKETDGTVVTNGGTDTIQLTTHGDHLFYDDLQAQEAKVRFDNLAAADVNDDGDITLEELALVKLASFPTDGSKGTYGTGSAAGINDLRAFVEALSRTVGHFRGEGECFASAK